MLIGHPISLVYMTVMILGEIVISRLVQQSWTIDEVENRTGFHAWRESQSGIAKGDYAALSARMSGCAVSLALDHRTSKFEQEVLSFASQFSSQHSFDTSGFQDLQVQRIMRPIRECEDTLKGRVASQDIEIDYLVQRTQNQLTAASPLKLLRTLLSAVSFYTCHRPADGKIAVQPHRTTRRNLNITFAKDSRTLASASKRDSSSMKTLAAVTEAHLPASFLAMPLFNWDVDQSAPVVKERFWIYWAVTVPLTLTMLIIWLSWTQADFASSRAGSEG
jgi:hypothetical protein